LPGRIENGYQSQSWQSILGVHDMFSYEGKKVIVTGAGRGIGRATA
jgi:hypothetical protein